MRTSTRFTYHNDCPRKHCSSMWSLLNLVICLTLAISACNISIGEPSDGESVGTKITAVITPKPKTSPIPESKAEDTPEPTEESATESAPLWVYLTASGNLILENPDGSYLVTSVEVPIDPWFGLPVASRHVTLAESEVYFHPLDLASLPEMTAISSEGTVRYILAPEMSGELVDAMPSRDGTSILWLYDITPVKPNLAADPVCDSSRGCVGRVYETVITDHAGAAARSLGQMTLEDPFPLLEIDSWSDDSSLVYLRRIPWMVASAYYLPIGGGFFSVSITDGTWTELSEDFLGPETAISPNGRWLARGSFGEGDLTLLVESTDGTRYEVPFLEDFVPLSAQMTFSPGSDQLLWMEIMATTEERSITLKGMSLDNGTVRAIYAFDEPLDRENLPYIGAWVEPSILAINDTWGTRLLNLDDATWVIRERPVGAEPHIILGTLTP
jgi:hypothetical protein